MEEIPANLLDRAAYYFGGGARIRSRSVRTTGPHTAGTGAVTSDVRDVYVVEMPVPMHDGSPAWQERGRGATPDLALRRALEGVSKGFLIRRGFDEDEAELAAELAHDRADGVL